MSKTRLITLRKCLNMFPYHEYNIAQYIETIVYFMTIKNIIISFRENSYIINNNTIVCTIGIKRYIINDTIYNYE